MITIVEKLGKMFKWKNDGIECWIKCGEGGEPGKSQGKISRLWSDI
jgi:hypothetical protein